MGVGVENVTKCHMRGGVAKVSHEIIKQYIYIFYVFGKKVHFLPLYYATNTTLVII
jgi:hypothetical protein